MLNNFIDMKTSQQITSNGSQNSAGDLIVNPVVLTPPNRYKSSLEIAQSKSNRKPLSDIYISSDKNIEGNRINQSESESLDIHKLRQCKNSKEYGHYSKTCSNK